MATLVAIQQETLRRALTRGNVTRAEVAAAGPYRQASVALAVDDLKRRGVLEEPERAGKRTGRRSPALSLASRAAAFLGVELTGRTLYAALCDARGDAVWTGAEDLPGPITPDELARRVARLAAACRKRRPELAGAALADPGLVDVARGVSLRAAGWPGWENVPTGELLRRAAGVEEALVAPECGARAFLAYTEGDTDAEAGGVFLLRLDAGVGAGWVNDGKLYAGHAHAAMEIGHWVVAPGGPLCVCGNRGCLEAVAGGEGVRRRVRDLNASGVRTTLDAETFTLDRLADAVAAGDHAAARLAGEVAEQIAPVFAVVAALLDPGRIAVSGAWTRLAAVLEPAARRALAERCLPDAAARTRIDWTVSDAFDGARGAARMLARRFWMKGSWR